MNTTTAQSIDTGDTVRHSPSGEDWLVAYVAGGMLCACGWPCTLVPVSECALTEKATAENRLELLRQLANGQGDDPRKRYAQRALATIETPTTTDRLAEMKVAAIVKAAFAWGSERTINDWDEAELAKAIAAHDGAWPGCTECDHHCDEPCMPHTVAEVHHAIDSRIAQLVHDGKLHAHMGYTPPAGWKPVAMPRTRRRPVTVNDELTTSFCDTLDGTRWHRLTAFRDVSAERNRQDEQWGATNHDDTHGALEWSDCLTKQLHQLGDKASRPRDRLVKIAAFAIAAIESADRIEAVGRIKAGAERQYGMKQPEHRGEPEAT
jgi:hypothetical protein